MFLDRIEVGTILRQKDGSYLANNYHRVWHWAADGSLIARIGARGEGPGEFQGISQVLWTGRYYWVLDARRLVSSVFDARGNYLFGKPFAFRQFVPIDDRLFALKASGFNPFENRYPRVLQEIEPNITDFDLVLQEGMLFRQMTPRQVALDYNFKLVWGVREGNNYLVVDQVDPTIRIYDDSVVQAEAEAEAKGKYQEPEKIELMLPHFVAPPEQMEIRFANNRQSIEWWQSWSRICYFGRAGENYIIAYEIPDPEDPIANQQVIQRLDREGRLLGKPLVVSGQFTGISGQQVHIFEVGESDVDFTYYIQIHDLGTTE